MVKGFDDVRSGSTQNVQKMMVNCHFFKAKSPPTMNESWRLKRDFVHPTLQVPQVTIGFFGR